MTDTELVEVVARAIRDKPESGCGLSLPNGEVAFCDDGRINSQARFIECECRDSARAAIEAMQPALREAELRGMRRAADYIENMRGNKPANLASMIRVLANAEEYTAKRNTPPIPLTLGGSDG